jgi:hypothetical protein
MNNICTWAPKIMKKVAMTSIWICFSSFTDHVFHILGESDKIDHLTPMYLTWPHTYLYLSSEMLRRCRCNCKRK